MGQDPDRAAVGRRTAMLGVDKQSCTFPDAVSAE